MAKSTYIRGFNRINSDRSIPTLYDGRTYDTCLGVSIVSIQTDQSRQKPITMPKINLGEFQSYQFRQINPDVTLIQKRGWHLYQVSIVSIQTDQSRPEYSSLQTAK